MSNPSLQPRSPRVPFVRPIHVSREDGSDAQWLLASNLSEGGLFVRTPQPLPIGTKVRLELEARGKSLRFAEAEVIWSRPLDLTRMTQGLPGFGVRFEALTEESKALVQHLVDVGGTGRGQAKTLPYTSPEALKLPLREPLHAPVAEMVARLTPSEDAVTGEYPPVAAAELSREPKVIVRFDEEAPLEMGDAGAVELNEPTLDRSALAALAPESRPMPNRSRSSVASWLAGAALSAAVVGACVFALRGFREALRDDEPTAASSTAEIARAAPVDEPAHEVVEAKPEPKAPVAIAEAAPAAVMTMPAQAVQAHVATKLPEPAAVKVAARTEAKPEPQQHETASQIALPSGAARAVALTEQGGNLEIRTELAPGSSIEKVFALSSPSRLVIDLKGPAPKGTPRVEGRAGVTAVRLGSRAGGTRLVLDLARNAGKVKTEGQAITIELK